jgi:hypothetical protein
MARAKSPNYPQIALGEALKAVRAAFDKDGRNKLSRSALAKHMGHDSLSGPALGKIGALRAYGLVEGAGDEMRITEDAVTAMMAPEGAPDRAAALSLLAARPKLFQEIRKDFPTLPSADNLQFWLVKRKFSSDAAKTAAKSYLGTMRLAGGESLSYNAAPEKQEPPMTPQAQHILDRPSASIQPPAAKSPMLQEVFNLDEGPVTLAFPSAMSEESYEELKAQLELFLRRAQRRARLRAQYDDPAYQEMRKAHVERVIARKDEDEAAN